MTQAVSVMRWDDAGAPQIVDGKPSEYMNVLKKCLVDGYGTTTPLNWIVVVDEINTATPLLVLKNDTALGGSGGFIVFDAENDTAGTLVKVQCCQSYIDRTTRVNAGAHFSFGRGTSSETRRVKNWVIFGTVSAFYMFGCYSDVISLSNNYFATNYSIFFFVGDYISLHPNDPATFITMSGSLNSPNHAWNNMLNGKLSWTDSNNVCEVYALDGSSNFEAHSINSIIGNNANGGNGNIDDEPVINVLTECFLSVGTNSRNHSLLNNASMPLIRGKVPGLYFSAEAGYGKKTMPFFKEIDAVQYFNVPSPSQNTSCAWINAEQW